MSSSKPLHPVDTGAKWFLEDQTPGDDLGSAYFQQLLSKHSLSFSLDPSLFMDNPNSAPQHFPTKFWITYSVPAPHDRSHKVSEPYCWNFVDRRFSEINNGINWKCIRRRPLLLVTTRVVGGDKLKYSFLNTEFSCFLQLINPGTFFFKLQDLGLMATTRRWVSPNEFYDIWPFTIFCSPFPSINNLAYIYQQSIFISFLFHPFIFRVWDRVTFADVYCLFLNCHTVRSGQRKNLMNTTPLFGGTTLWRTIEA